MASSYPMHAHGSQRLRHVLLSAMLARTASENNGDWCDSTRVTAYIADYPTKGNQSR